MATFLSLYDKHLSELAAAIPEETTPDRAAENIRVFLDRLSDEYHASAELPDHVAVAARAGMDILRDATGVLVSASRSQIWFQPGPGGLPGTQRKRHFLWTRILLSSVVVAVVAFAGLVLWTAQQIDALVLLIAAGALELLRIVISFVGGRRGRRDVDRTVSGMRSQAVVHVDTEALQARLSHALGALDKLVERAAAVRPSIASAGPVIEDPGFTELLQDLMEARETSDGEYALRVLRSLRAVLERHGIRVVSFDGANRNLFEFTPTVDSSPREVTLRPALVHEGRVLRRGLVAAPSRPA